MGRILRKISEPLRKVTTILVILSILLILKFINSEHFDRL
jgi:hypothetical protein